MGRSERRRRDRIHAGLESPFAWVQQLSSLQNTVRRALDKLPDVLVSAAIVRGRREHHGLK